MHYHVDPDISRAETLPATFYRSTQVFDKIKEKIFGGCWHWLGDVSLYPVQIGATPVNLLEGFLDEPLIVSRTEADELVVLSNICTHRANLILHGPVESRQLVCGYHGRRFDLNGQMRHMPEFESVQDFPRKCDHLPGFDLKQFGPFLMTSLDPLFDIEPVIDEIQKRIGFLPLHEFVRRDDLSKDYLVNAHWALYCDNYLEGFHIPFVHADLHAVLDYGSYETLCFEHMSLQIGYSSGGEEVFDLPAGHVDYGKEVAAYYFWIFPNLMLNFYPWGLSVNVVKPINPGKTKVSFITYVYDESRLHSGAGALLDKVEREDEFVVEGVHRGLMSKQYTTGRFSPGREQGVHHFHRLLARYVSED